MCPNCLLILIGGNLSRMALLSPAGWRYAVWGARWVGKSICSSAIMNHCCHCRWRYLKKSPALADLLPALPCLLTITLLRGCISGQMGPDDQHYHNLAHPKHTPILTIKCWDGFWEDSTTRIKGWNPTAKIKLHCSTVANATCIGMLHFWSHSYSNPFLFLTDESSYSCFWV